MAHKLKHVIIDMLVTSAHYFALFTGSFRQSSTCVFLLAGYEGKRKCSTEKTMNHQFTSTIAIHSTFCFFKCVPFRYFYDDEIHF